MTSDRFETHMMDGAVTVKDPVTTRGIKTAIGAGESPRSATRRAVAELERVVAALPADATWCQKCGAQLVVGAWPFCPHGIGVSNVEGVTWPGGKTFENLGHEPQTFYSKSEYRQYLRAHNLEECVKWAGPNDQHVKSWVTMDAQTLANAAALVRPRGYIASLEQTTTDVDGFVTERIEGVHVS